jgi:GT2 family glycosyltransferase
MVGRWTIQDMSTNMAPEQMADAPEQRQMELSVVIVNYNGGELFERCVASLYEHAPSRSFEVIVVDNGSTDGSPDRLAIAHPGVRLIRQPANIGLAKAFNRGVSLMSGRYLLSLDDGTSVLPGAMDALLDFMDANPAVGAAGARLYDPDMTVQPVARRFPHPLNAVFGRRSIATRLFPNVSLVRRYLMPEFADSRQPFAVDWCSSAALIVRRAVISHVGAMDPKYFVYWVDADWCFRMRKAGWNIFCVPQARVVHLENLRTGHRPQPRSRMVIDFHRGAYRFYRTNYLRAGWTPMGLLSMGGLTVRAACILAVNEVRRLLRVGNLRRTKSVASGAPPRVDLT